MTLKVDIAGICLALESDDDCGDFFGGYVTDAQPEGVIRVEWGGPPVEGPGFSVQGDGYAGRYHLEAGRGACRAEGVEGLQHFLWDLATALLPQRDGLVLHAASLSDGERAYLFPAPSGTGKSTLVRHSPGFRLLSDEGTLVRFVDGRLWAYSSPFRSDNYRDFAGGGAPVAGIYFLRQAPVDRVLPLSPGEALQRLLRETFLFVDDAASRVRAFQVADQVVRAVAPSLLSLRNGPDFWGCIHADQTRAGVPAAG